MNEQIKNEWVIALRSGEYKQMGNGLFDGECYCVLGVACELYRIKHPKVKWEQDADIKGMYFFMDCVGVLPQKVADWMKVDRAPKINKEFLHELNDKGKSFNELADLIEKHL
jgi:hypothetical protein